MHHPGSILPSDIFFFLGPLPPEMVRLSSKGQTDRLSAAWEPASGHQEGYSLTLYYAGSDSVAVKAYTDKDTTNFTFLGLLPGTKYVLQVASMAGPYQISAGNVSDWTCEYEFLYALLVCTCPIIFPGGIIADWRETGLV